MTLSAEAASLSAKTRAGKNKGMKTEGSLAVCGQHPTDGRSTAQRFALSLLHTACAPPKYMTSYQLIIFHYLSQMEKDTLAMEFVPWIFTALVLGKGRAWEVWMLPEKSPALVSFCSFALLILLKAPALTGGIQTRQSPQDADFGQFPISH